MATTHSGPGLTYADFLAFPEDGQRHELVGGVHVVSAAPSLRHQAAFGALFASLYAQIEVVGSGSVFGAPTAVRLGDEDGVQPDIAVVIAGSRARLREREIDGPPDLVVEILSRSTRRLDLEPKRDAYARSGVAEYWVVDLEARHVLRFFWDASGFAEPAVCRDRIEPAALPGVAVDLTAVWARVAAIGPG